MNGIDDLIKQVDKSSNEPIQLTTSPRVEDSKAPGSVEADFMNDSISLQKSMDVRARQTMQGRESSKTNYAHRQKSQMMEKSNKKNKMGRLNSTTEYSVENASASVCIPNSGEGLRDSRDKDFQKLQKYKQFERKRGDNESIVQASAIATVAVRTIDSSMEKAGIEPVLNAHQSKQLNVDNYLSHLKR